jgi:uncharacterized membrane protein
MMTRLFFLIILFAATAFQAGPVAAASVTYEVTGVSTNDVLNVRSGPHATTTKVDSYGPRDSGIRIYRREGDWALVGRANADKPDGWVNARYLKKTMAAARLELPLQCLGTEPFWSLTINSTRRATYSDPETKARRYAINEFRRVGRGAQMRLGSTGRVAISAGTCSDGMSDNVYPYSVRATLPGGGNLSGCCR